MDVMNDLSFNRYFSFNRALQSESSESLGWKSLSGSTFFLCFWGLGDCGISCVLSGHVGKTNGAVEVVAGLACGGLTSIFKLSSWAA